MISRTSVKYCPVLSLAKNNEKKVIVQSLFFYFHDVFFGGNQTGDDLNGKELRYGKYVFRKRVRLGVREVTLHGPHIHLCPIKVLTAVVFSRDNIVKFCTRTTVLVGKFCTLFPIRELRFWREENCFIFMLSLVSNICQIRIKNLRPQSINSQSKCNLYFS